MEIRCDTCDFVGEAAEVRAVPGGVGLVCARCSFTTVLKLSENKETSGTVKGESVEEIGQAELDAVLYLIPAAGDGPRCPKCLAMIGKNGDEERKHCARCGLKVTEIDRFEPGCAPWEVAPPGKKASFAKAEALWPASDGLDAVRLDTWREYVQAEDLLDYGIRKLQLVLIENPDNAQALEALARIEKKIQQRVFVATTEAELSAKAYSGEVSRLRQKLLVFSLVFWLVILILFGIVFWGKC